jgi:hypothetical protein
MLYKERNIEKDTKVKRTQKRVQRQLGLHALIGHRGKVMTSTTSLRTSLYTSTTSLWTSLYTSTMSLQTSLTSLWSLWTDTARAVLSGDRKLFSTAALHVVYVGIKRGRVRLQSGNGTRKRHTKRLGKSWLYTYKQDLRL